LAGTLQSLGNIGRDPQMANRIVQALIESTGGGAAPARMPAAKPQPGPVSSQAQLMSPEDLPYMDRLFRGQEMPFDVGGPVKSVSVIAKNGARRFSTIEEAIQYARSLGDNFRGAFKELSNGKIEPLLGFGGPRFGAKGPVNPNAPTQATSVTDATSRFAQRNPEVVKPDFVVSRAEHAAMRDSPYYGQRLGELVSDKAFFGANKEFGKATAHTQQVLLDGIANENTVPIIHRIIQSPTPSPENLKVLRSFVRNTTDKELVDYFNSAEISGMAQILRSTGDTRALDNLASALRRPLQFPARQIPGR